MNVSLKSKRVINNINFRIYKKEKIKTEKENKLFYINQKK